MVDIVALTKTVAGILEAPFSIASSVLSMIGNWIIHVRANQVEVPGEPTKRPIGTANDPIRLPKGVLEITLHGSSWLSPSSRDYVVLVRKDKKVWPKGRLEFTNRMWKSSFYISSVGIHDVLIAKLSPELDAFVEYYWEKQRVLESYKKKLKAELPKEFVGLADDLPVLTGIAMDKAHLPGLNILQHIQIEISDWRALLEVWV